MKDDFIPDWIFGYGSLINVASRTLTDPLIGPARPVMVQGLQRGWWVHGGQTPDTTYLGAEPAADVACGGVIFAKDGGIVELNRREHKYRFERLDPMRSTALDGGAIDPRVSYGYYRNKQRELPDAKAPLTLSYVDIVMSGCWQLQQIFPLALKSNFYGAFRGFDAELVDRLGQRPPLSAPTDVRRADDAGDRQMPEGVGARVRVHHDRMMRRQRLRTVAGTDWLTCVVSDYYARGRTRTHAFAGRMQLIAGRRRGIWQ